MSMGKTATKWKASDSNVRFNLSTYKLHALGDYTDTIHQQATTDSYSTQMVGTFIINTPTR